MQHRTLKINMKKITLLFLFVFTILSGCKKDGAERNSDRLIGKWNVESVAYIRYENGKETEREQYSNVTLAWDFRNDGTAAVNFEGGEEQVTWIATDDQIQFKREDGEQLDFKINSLTKNSMNVVFEQRMEVENGITYRSTVQFILRK